MKRKRLKKLIALCMTSGMILMSTGTAMAAPTTSSWSVLYVKGAPATTANPQTTATVSYGSSYTANCKSFSGDSNAKVTVKSTSYSMSTVSIRGKGSRTFRVTGNTSKNAVTFKFVASGSTSCSASGIITANN